MSPAAPPNAVAVLRSKRVCILQLFRRRCFGECLFIFTEKVLLPGLIFVLDKLILALRGAPFQ